MSDQSHSAEDDMQAIPALISRIDRLLEEDSADTGSEPEMSAEELDYASTKLMKLLGFEPATDDQSQPDDDLEWEHFVLIAAAAYDPAPTSRDTEPLTVRRDVRLTEQHLVAAITGETEQHQLPVLRVERHDDRTSARLIDTAEIDPDVRVRVTIGEASIDLSMTEGELRGSSPTLIDADVLTNAKINVSVLHR